MTPWFRSLLALPAVRHLLSIVFATILAAAVTFLLNKVGI